MVMEPSKEALPSWWNHTTPFFYFCFILHHENMDFEVANLEGLIGDSYVDELLIHFGYFP